MPCPKRKMRFKKLKKFKRGAKKQYAIVKPKIKKGYQVAKAKYKKAQPKMRKISQNIDTYFNESSRQIREFKLRV